MNCVKSKTEIDSSHFKRRLPFFCKSITSVLHCTKPHFCCRWIKRKKQQWHNNQLNILIWGRSSEGFHNTAASFASQFPQLVHCALGNSLAPTLASTIFPTNGYSSSNYIFRCRPIHNCAVQRVQNRIKHCFHGWRNMRMPTIQHLWPT